MFKTKQIKTQVLGEKLRSARESMKLALWQASRKTRIPAGYLKNLEEGNYKELPADVYIMAYLRKYADLLNLNIDEILEQFKTEQGLIKNLSRTNSNRDLSKVGKKPFLIITPQRFSLVFALIVIAIVFGYFWHQLSYLIYPPAIKITQPASDITIQNKSIEVFGQTGSDVYLTINGKEVYVDSKGYFKSMVDLEVGLNTLKIEARDRFGKTNAVIRRVMVIK